MTNCGERFYSAVNDKAFISDLAKTARKYCSKSGGDNKEAAEVALDVIQAWGEAFLTKRQRYPNITDIYFELKKEGLPFKSAQFDSSRVPIFSDSFVALNAPHSSPTKLTADTSVKSPLNNNRASSSTSSSSSSSSAPAPSSSFVPTNFSSPQSSSYPAEGAAEDSVALLTSDNVVSSLTFFLSVLRESIEALNDGERFVESEIISEMVTDIKPLGKRLTDIIEESLSHSSQPEVDLPSFFILLKVIFTYRRKLRSFCC